MLRGNSKKGLLPKLGQDKPNKEKEVPLVIIIGSMLMIGVVGVVMIHVLF